jgi:CheY-like chemotaxis protein
VEDEPLILLDCESMLRGLGVGQVASATSDKEARALLDDGRRFDAAILDISLGGSSSFALASHLAGINVPAGFMSGYSAADLPDELKGRPYVNKPFAQEQLKLLLETLLAQRVRPVAGPGQA